MKVIDGLYYSEDHEWVKVEEGIAIIGITDFAQESLGEIVYVEVPEVGDKLGADDVFATVESVKAASDCNLPVSGKVVEVNDELEDSPQLINEDAYSAWIAKIEMDDKGELERLMDATEYKERYEEE